MKSITKSIFRGVEHAKFVADIFSRPYSKLSIISDGAGWSLDQDAAELLKIAIRLKLAGRITSLKNPSSNQCVHYISRFWLKHESILATSNRISFDYYHGNPATCADFKSTYETLKKNHEKIYRIRVSQSQMEQLILASGIEPQKVFRIPIGVNTDFFQQHTETEKLSVRYGLGVPENAIAIGAFQKDGNGWGEGLEPKLIKGPDVFLKTIEILKGEIPNLWIVLSGPARGYVKRGLHRMGVPFVHKYCKRYRNLGALYKALDLYIISSREEGGPKALLESMASGVPVVSTRVGQVMDLAEHEKNALVVDIEDYQGLANCALKVLGDEKLRKKVVDAGYITAENNSYDNQTEEWKAFFDGYVEH